MLVAYASDLLFQVTSQHNLYTPIEEDEDNSENSNEEKERELTQWEAIGWLSILTAWMFALSGCLEEAFFDINLEDKVIFEPRDIDMNHTDKVNIDVSSKVDMTANEINQAAKMASESKRTIEVEGENKAHVKYTELLNEAQEGKTCVGTSLSFGIERNDIWEGTTEYYYLLVSVALQFILYFLLSPFR